MLLGKGNKHPETITKSHKDNDLPPSRSLHLQLACLIHTHIQIELHIRLIQAAVSFRRKHLAFLLFIAISIGLPYTVNCSQIRYGISASL